MLQRIQTVFLFIIAVLMVLFQLFPIWTTSPGVEGTVYRLYAFFLFVGPENNPEAGNWVFWPFFIPGVFAGLVIIVTLVEAFSYKKRMTQIKMGALNSLLLAGVLISTIWFVNQGQAEWTVEHPGNYGIGIFFPVVSIINNLLANRFIRKDENLVRSMDRIR
jgi:hypothetical protein